MNTTISILGCGWYGLPMATTLVSNGYKVKGSTTSPQKLSDLSKSKISPYLIDIQNDTIENEGDFFDTDVLIIAIPPKRSTAEQHLFTSKIDAIICASKQRVKHVIFISSISVYGDNNSHLNELSVPKPKTQSGKVILQAEDALRKSNNFTTTILRFAGLIGPGRDPGKFFAGKTNIPNGQAPINLILQKDCIDITLSIIKQRAFGYTYNACIPDHPSKQWFYARASAKSALPHPIFIDQLDNWKIIESENVTSILNYKFSIDKWSDWL